MVGGDGPIDAVSNSFLARGNRDVERGWPVGHGVGTLAHVGVLEDGGGH